MWATVAIVAAAVVAVAAVVVGVACHRPHLPHAPPRGTLAAAFKRQRAGMLTHLITRYGLTTEFEGYLVTADPALVAHLLTTAVRAAPPTPTRFAHRHTNDDDVTPSAAPPPPSRNTLRGGRGSTACRRTCCRTWTAC